MMSERIRRIQSAVETTAGCKALHIQSTPIREVFQGKVVWEGVVEVFSLLDHPTVARCYGWSYRDNKGGTQFVTVMEKPPVTSPQSAVKVAIMAGEATS